MADNPAVLRVQKYGGTSLADAAMIRHAAAQVVSAHQAGDDTVVVVSAMGSTTDDLLSLAHEVTPRPGHRELDVLLSTGECTSAALLALAIQELGVPACSLSGPAAGIVTDGEFGNARIVDVDPTRIQTELGTGAVVVVTGFQGRCRDTGELTTLGRGGSDATASALAAALGAAVCEVVTDVDGVYTADPRWVSDARRLERLPYEQMLDLARSGARVLMPRCVEHAMAHRVPLHIRSATDSTTGTWVGPMPAGVAPAERPHKGHVIDGLARLPRQSFFTLTVPGDEPAAVTTVVSALAEAGIAPDVSTRATAEGRLEMSFLVHEHDASRAEEALEPLRRAHGLDGFQRSEPLGRLSIVGAGLRANPSLTCTLLSALSTAGVEIRDTDLRDHRIAVLCPEDQLTSALVAAHDALVPDNPHRSGAVGLTAAIPGQTTETGLAPQPLVAQANGTSNA